MAIRKLSGLISARELSEAPSFAKASRARGAKREGIKYENAFVSALGSCARHGVWFEGMDKKGPFWAQPDVLLRTKDGIVVFECKYTWVPDAEEKLRKLYIPLVEAIFGGNVSGIVVCKRLSPDTPRDFIARGLKAAIFDSFHRIDMRSRVIPVLHWDQEWSFMELNSKEILPWQPKVQSRNPAPTKANPTLSATVAAQRNLKLAECPVV